MTNDRRLYAIWCVALPSGALKYHALPTTGDEPRLKCAQVVARCMAQTADAAMVRFCLGHVEYVEEDER